MSAPEQVQVTQRAEEVAEEIVSAANIVTNGGYYEIDIDAVSVAVARFEAETRHTAQSDLLAAMREAAEWLRAISTWLLETDNDMKLPNGVLDTDPLDIADKLTAAIDQMGGG